MFRSPLRYAVIALALAFLGACDQPEQAVDKSGEVLKRADSYFRQGQFNAAAIEVKNALKENSSNLDAYLLLARIYLEQGNYHQSIKVLQSLPQDDLRVATLLAENYLYQGKFKSMHQALLPMQQREDAKNSPAFQLLLARSHILRDKPGDADGILKSLAATASDQALQSNIELVRAFYHQRQNQPDKQLAALEKALTINPENIEALVEKANLMMQSEDFEGAEDLLTRALIVLPSTDTMTLKRLSILQAMVVVLSRQGRSVEAMVYSKLIAEASPKAQEMQTEFQSAIEQLQAGNIKQAEEILSDMYSSDNARMAGSLLGLIKFQQGDFREAVQLFDDTIDPETASPEALRAYAEAQLRLQNPELALKTIEANVRQHPDNADILGVYGLSLLATNNQEKGIETIKAALKIDPDRARLRLALVDTYNRRGELDAALEQLEAAQRATPDDILLQERLLKQYRIMKKDTALAALVNELAAKPAPQSQALAGLALLASDRPRAIGLLDKAYQSAPADPAVLRAQIARYTVTGEHQKALRFGKELVAINSDDLFALSSVAQAELARNRPKAAVAYLNETSLKHPNAWGPDYVLAQYYFSTGAIDLALKHADVALARSSFSRVTTGLASGVYLAKAQQQATNRDFAGARQTIMDGLQISSSNLALMHLLVNIELEEKNLKAAEKLVGEIEQMAAGSHTAYLANADLAAARGDEQAALDGYRSAWKMQATDRLGNILWSKMKSASDASRSAFLAEWKQRVPNSFQVHTIEGLYLQEAGKPEEAMDAYRESLAINGRQPAAVNNLAWLIYEAGDTKKALEYAASAYEMNPTNPSILDTYGWVAFKNGDSKLALEMLEQAAALLPENQEISSHLDQVRKAK